MEMKSEQIEHQQRKVIQCNVIGFSDYGIKIINIFKTLISHNLHSYTIMGIISIQDCDCICLWLITEIDTCKYIKIICTLQYRILQLNIVIILKIF